MILWKDFQYKTYFLSGLYIDQCGASIILPTSCCCSQVRQSESGAFLAHKLLNSAKSTVILHCPCKLENYISCGEYFHMVLTSKVVMFTYEWDHRVTGAKYSHNTVENFTGWQ